jgi:hypothetical protein
MAENAVARERANDPARATASPPRFATLISSQHRAVIGAVFLRDDNVSARHLFFTGASQLQAFRRDPA